MCKPPQVVSVYAEPDIMELNYHAGTACWTVAQSVVTEHVGVRFYGSEIADAITAVLFISICMDGGLNLPKVNLDTQTINIAISPTLLFDDYYQHLAHMH